MAHRERTSSSFRTRSDAIAKSWRLGFTFLLLAQLFGSSLAIRWLALSRVSSLGVSHSPASVCDELSSSLVTKQVQFCKKHPGFMSSVQNGAAAAIDECKFQFRSRRWNCSTLDELPTVVSLQQPTALPQKSKATSPGTSKKKPKTVVSRDVNAGNSSVGFVAEAQIPERKPTAPNVNAFSPYPVVPAGTRESAFVHAISAAGVAHSLTRACSSGELEDCGCDRTVRGASPEGFQWAGCSDNVHFGTSFSRTFVDAREHRATKKSAGKNGKNAEAVWRALMNLHNNEAGRKVVEKSMRIECKCHGVSGSCELRTCWKAMPSFREIGELLKEKFDGATEVEVRTWHSGSRRQLVPRSPTYKPHTDADLVYLDRSPDYCEYDAAIGSLGTHGRPCNKTSKAIDGCDLLCCNRGYKSHRERRSERCMCKFHWCCSVQCKTCVRDVEVHTCL